MFTVIFTVEMLFKIYALSLSGYAKDGFNLFDGILVVVSLFDWGIEVIMGSSSGMGVLTVFRTLRLLRVFKLATRSKGLLILLTVHNFLLTTLPFIGHYENLDRYLLLFFTAGALCVYLCVTRYGSLRLQC